MRPMLAFSWTYLIPLYVLVFLGVLLAIFALLARIQGGRFVRPLVKQIARVPFFRKQLTKASTAALERENPELASAVRKLERMGAITDPQRAQKAMSTLTPAERRAYMAAAEKEGAIPEATNRQMRRRLEKARRDARKT
jgi:hypothetical protein